MPNALLLSIGSKVALARIAMESARRRGIALHASDHSEDVPASQSVDRFHLFDFRQGIDALIALCRKEGIELVIPTRHSDLPLLSRSREALSSHGIEAAISNFETVELCTDKLKTASFFANHSVPAPPTFDAQSLNKNELEPLFPLIAKPVRGSASQGIRVLRSFDELEADPIDASSVVQALAKGDEYTINVYIDKQGEITSTIPHKRMIVSEGEAVQAITARIPTLIEQANRIAAALPGARGPLNIQAFWDEESGRAQFIEINPRIGGGFPLAHQAGGRFIEWLFQERFDQAAPRKTDKWTEGLRMMRYRDAIFDLPQL
jgi:carbamoyl-phosphate synthase large subunit